MCAFSSTCVRACGQDLLIIASDTTMNVYHPVNHNELVNRQTDRQTYRQTDRQTERQTDRQTDIPKDRQTYLGSEPRVWDRMMVYVTMICE